MNIVLIYTNDFWSGDTIVAICAIIVSVVGIGLGSYFNWKNLKNTKEHNKKSVRPSLKFERSFDELNYRMENGLINAGSGPAFVTKLLFICDGKEYSSLANLLSQKIKIYDALVDKQKNTESTFDKREVIASSDYQNIYETSFMVNEHMFEIKRVLRMTEIYVEYESIYGEKFVMREFIHTSVKIV